MLYSVDLSIFRVKNERGGRGIRDSKFAAVLFIEKKNDRFSDQNTVVLTLSTISQKREKIINKGER